MKHDITFNENNEYIDFVCDGVPGLLYIFDDEITVESPADPFAVLPARGAHNLEDILANEDLRDELCDKIAAYARYAKV